MPSPGRQIRRAGAKLVSAATYAPATRSDTNRVAAIVA
jgi:hypothetical protein